MSPPTVPRPLGSLPVAAESFGEWALDEPLRILLIAIGAVVLSRLARRSIRRGLERIRAGSVSRRMDIAVELAPKALRDGAGAGERAGQRLDAISSVTQGAVAAFVYLVALLMILGELGINLAPLLAGAGVAGVADRLWRAELGQGLLQRPVHPDRGPVRGRRHRRPRRGNRHG